MEDGVLEEIAEFAWVHGLAHVHLGSLDDADGELFAADQDRGGRRRQTVHEIAQQSRGEAAYRPAEVRAQGTQSA